MRRMFKLSLYCNVVFYRIKKMLCIGEHMHWFAHDCQVPLLVYNNYVSLKNENVLVCLC